METTNIQPEKLRVVVVKGKTLYKSEILRDDLKNDELGRITLPENTYSAGWCARVWDVVWEDLEPLEN